VYAEILRSLNVNQQGPSPEGESMGEQSGGMGGNGTVPANTGPMDATGTGNGTIGTGVAPSPGEAGFAATTSSTENIG